MIAEVIELLKFMPRTNCGECGFKTCSHFVFTLGEGYAEAERCPYISDELRSQIVTISISAKEKLEAEMRKRKPFSPKKGLCSHPFDKLVRVNTSCGFVDGTLIRCTLCGKDLSGSFSHEYDDYYFPGADYDTEWSNSRDGWYAMCNHYSIPETEERWDKAKMETLVPKAKRFDED